MIVSGSRWPPPWAEIRSIASTYCSGCTAVRSERATGGDCTRSNPSQPRSDSSCSIALILAGCSGWRAGVVLERARVLQEHGRHREYRTARCRPPNHKSWHSRSRWSAPAPPGCTRRCAPPARAARVTPGLGHAAGRVVELVGPGRPRRGDVQPTTARAAISRTRSPPDGARSASRPRGCCARRRRTRSRTWPGSGCASTPIATARCRSASRAATARAGSSTPAARRPAAGSSGS